MSATAEDLAGVQPQGTDPESLPGGVQAPDPAPVPQSEQEWEAALDNLDSEQLGALLAAPPVSQPASQQEAPPPVNATPDDEIEEEEEQAPAPAPQPSAALDRPGAPARIRLNGIPEEQASKVAQYVEAIRSGKSPEEAAAILAPPAPAAVPAAEQAQVDPPAPVARPELVAPPEVDAAQARVTEAEEALKAAKATYDAVEISDATLALIDAKNELAAAKDQARQQQAEADRYNQEFERHVTSLCQSFPELDENSPSYNPNSPLAARLEELRDLESVRNPGFDNDPAFILRLAAKAAQDVGARTAANTPIPQPNPTAKAQGRVTPGGAPVAKAMTKEAAERQFDQVLDRMSDEERQAFLANILPIPG